jgi:hypothetical protein
MGIFVTPASVTWLFILLFNLNHASFQEHLKFADFIFVWHRTCKTKFSTLLYIVLVYDTVDEGLF